MLPSGLAVRHVGCSWRTSPGKISGSSDRTPPRLDKTWYTVLYQDELSSRLTLALFQMLMLAISRQQHSEVYTLGIFNYKIYVINSRRLIPLVQRLSKTLSFTPFQQLAAKAFVDCSAKTVELHGDPDFLCDLDKITKGALAPGTHLDYQNLRTVNSLEQEIDILLLGSSTDAPVRIRFYEWSKHAITLAATNGLYGNSNPFLDKHIEESFW
jgi:hypothetical protein